MNDSDSDVESLSNDDGMIVDDGEYLNQEQPDYSDAEEAEDNAAETETDEMMGVCSIETTSYLMLPYYVIYHSMSFHLHLFVLLIIP